MRGPRGRLVLGLFVLGLGIVPAAAALTAATGDPERGEPLYRRHCAVCHGAAGQGDGPNASFLDDDQPRDLTDPRYMGGRRDEQLFRVIAEGGQAIQGSRFMPPWGRTLLPSQIWDLVAFIRALSAPARASPPPTGGPSAGAVLASELGCAACHRIGGLERVAVGPDLRAERSRVQRAWLVDFLRAPRAIRPAGYRPLWRSRMPDFRLSEEEAAALAEYLMSRPEREEKGPDSPPPPGEVERGRDLFRRHACRACHSREGAGGRAGPDLSTVAGRLKPAWTLRFLENPQAVDPLSPMPHLGMGGDDARAITSYLFDGGPPPPEPAPDPGAASRGEALFRSLGCGGCHDDARHEPVGPDLSGTGDKLKAEWLSQFLRRPDRVRPWLTARMPDFRLSDDEARILLGFLGGLRDPAAAGLPERLRFRDVPPEANVHAGRRLASREFLSCASCHLGEDQPEGAPEEWAPDLRISGQRLQPDWIVRWLHDPRRLAPGTKMPTYFSDAASGPEDILDGDEERQILALRDYILSLGATGGAPGKAPPGH